MGSGRRQFSSRSTCTFDNATPYMRAAVQTLEMVNIYYPGHLLTVPIPDPLKLPHHHQVPGRGLSTLECFLFQYLILTQPSELGASVPILKWGTRDSKTPKKVPKG